MSQCQDSLSFRLVFLVMPIKFIVKIDQYNKNEANDYEVSPATNIKLISTPLFFFFLPFISNENMWKRSKYRWFRIKGSMDNKPF